MILAYFVVEGWGGVGFPMHCLRFCSRKLHYMYCDCRGTTTVTQWHVFKISGVGLVGEGEGGKNFPSVVGGCFWCSLEGEVIFLPHVVSRGAVRSAASSYAAMRTVAGSSPVLVIVWEWHIGLALLCGCSGALEHPTTNSCGPINKSLSLSLHTEFPRLDALHVLDASARFNAGCSGCLTF